MYTKQILDEIEELEKKGEAAKASVLRDALKNYLDKQDKAKGKEETR
jgi:metal-responsive CopG/Arc/MetJ family transcriptional regulator